MNHVQTISVPAKQINYFEISISLQSEDCSVRTEENNMIANEKEVLSGSMQEYLYAIGKINPVFPSIGLEKEFHRVAVLSKSAVSEDHLLFDVLSKEQYHYIAAEMRWVMKINNVKTYLVQPSGIVELKELINTLRPELGMTTYQVIIGHLGVMEPVKPGGDEQLTTVACDLLYSVTFDEFVDSIVKKTAVDKAVVGSLFKQLLNKISNTGARDEDRAVNYIALKYSDVYKMTGELLQSSPTSPIYSFVDVVSKHARVQGMRKIVDVTFRYKERVTGKFICKTATVDTTGLFPFLLKEFRDDHPRP